MRKVLPMILYSAQVPSSYSIKKSGTTRTGIKTQSGS